MSQAATPASARDPAGPFATYIAVGAPSAATEPDAGEWRAVDRQLTAQRLREAAMRAVLANLSLWGLVMATGTVLVGIAAPIDAVLATWLVASLALTALAFRPPLVLGRQQPSPVQLRRVHLQLIALTAMAAFTFAALPWLAPGDSIVLAVVAVSVSLVGAAALAPMRAMGSFMCLVPASMAGADLLAGHGAMALQAAAAAGLVMLAILVVARMRHRAWRHNALALVEQADHIRDLESERDAAARADAEKSRFLAIASHDLRQPVHALALFTATLHRRMLHSTDEPLVRNMARAIDGLERSFNALLDISRLDAGGVAPSLQTFSLRDIFRRLHMHYAGHAELAGLGLRLSPGGKTVHSDPQMLERILGNLIQNAIKYTEHGGIVVVARSTADVVNVEVWDTGKGIAANELPCIFDEYYQIGRPERDRSHGLGMGLAIVKRLTRLLGHRLTVASRSGRGTMFRVGIPVASLPDLQDALAPADTVPMQVTQSQMVLVIDDEEPIREGLRGLLQEWGYQAVTAASLAQAEQVTQALEGRVDLVLSDLHLGNGADGLEAIEAVRRLCRHDVMAIIITGDTAATEIRRITASGDMVLFKPLQPRRLFDALNNQLG